jgi:ribosomal protein L12E/L44/L45/RPP1/RPP2
MTLLIKSLFVAALLGIAAPTVRAEEAPPADGSKKDAKADKKDKKKAKKDEKKDEKNADGGW